MKFFLKTALLFVSALLVGFLLFFFYQTLVDSQLEKFESTYGFGLPQDAKSFLLLRGWQTESGDGRPYASMALERSTFVFNIPAKDTVRLTFRYRAQEPGQLVKIYKYSTELGVLASDAPGKWTDTQLIVDRDFIEEGLNRIELIKEGPAPVDFFQVTAANYQNTNLVFLRSHIVWESTKWFQKREGVSVNWSICFMGAFIFSALWLAYSALFWPLTREKFLKIVRLDFSTYLLPLLVLSILFIISKVIFSYTFFYEKFDFFLIFIGLACIGKIYQIMRYARGDMFILRLRQLYRYTVKKYHVYANIFICLFVLMMFFCAGLLMFDLRPWAERLANIAFFVLISGFLLKFVEYFIERHYNTE